MGGAARVEGSERHRLAELAHTGHGGIAALDEGVVEGLAARFFAVDQPHLLFGAADPIVVIEEFGVVGVTAERVDGVDVGPNLVFVAKDTDFFPALANLPTQSVLGTVTDE